MQTATRTKPAKHDELRSLGDILDALENSSHDGSVSVGDVLDEVGVRSFAPIILVPALILVSPLSGIIGLPTIGATFIFLITIQKLLGRPQVWMPGILKRRRVKEEKLNKAVDWLRKPTRWIDQRTHKRLTALVSRPANIITLLLILAICLIIPALEILPMVTSIFAAAISFLAIGLLARDGLFTLLGYIQAAISCGVIWWMISSGIGGFGG
ncbi:exopolysaccharide biosynthesis protein [Pseudooceanicola sediminis]|uniref:Exopolysaccharide biosynthesis protein n=1 Tax=Pseudooceanicola sediminis TaxID=2211117 RepID=A0A399J1H0_9RHOB|nr:exopolysaccharide biosynthesis protein [Pseudooceanicola sediminis]KAA2313330.1 exopolysaccharide biosynthesis protein [Puniceibacterium sp. HSS470]RII38389.1 exopolysaccharide biosynthesis protein [Pseudooceanicola sediminis]|tara:strand:- start:41793 stop:42428 length:636 start_codon:yes stop_codon:yes gene_type:complete